MHFDFVPEKDSGLTGKAVLKSLSIEERLDVGEMLTDDAHLLSSDDDGDKAKVSIKLMRISLGFVKNHIVEVGMKNKDGKEYKSFDDLNDDDECHPIIMDMARVYMEKIDLGKLLRA